MPNALESAVHKQDPSISRAGAPEDAAAVAAGAEAPQVKDKAAGARPAQTSCCEPECCQ